MRFEPLEHRLVMAAPTLDPIIDVVVPAGTTLMVPLNGHDADGNSLSFTASSSGSAITPTVMPATNRSLRINVAGFGEMDLQLFENLTPNTAARIIQFAQAGFYSHGTTASDPMTFHRIMKGFMIQGGDPTGIGSGSSGTTPIGLETLSDLQFSGAGVLGMARSTDPNSNDCQFFITDAAATFLNNNYTVFGFLTKGQSVEQAIASVQVTSNGQGEQSKPVTPVTFTIDPATGVYTDPENGVLLLKAQTGAAGYSTITVTASDGQGGTALRTFRVYAAAAAPSAVTITGGGSTRIGLNNSSAKPMHFTVSDVLQGATVILKDEQGRVLYTGTNYTRTGNQVDVTTNGAVTLSDGVHKITALQTYQGATTAASPQLQITVDTAAPQITSSPVAYIAAGQPYAYEAKTNAASGETVTYSLLTSPSGMTINAGTGRLTWTSAGPVGDQAVSLLATDGAGNSSTQSFTIHVLDAASGAVINLPTAAAGVKATLRRHGDNIQVINTGTGQVLLDQLLAATLAMTIVGVGGQADQLTIAFNDGGAFSFAGGLTFDGGGGADSLIIHATTGADTLEVNGTLATANGLKTTMTRVGKLRLEGDAGNDNYKLAASSLPVAVVDATGSDTLDFSGATGGVTVNLGLDAGQTQTIAPWHTTLAITGDFSKLIGTSFADVLTGGAAATTIIRGMGGNDTLRAGGGVSILLGGDGSDTLYGGAKNNLLIGGLGTDTLRGGTGGNILIGGTTSYDANDQALLSVVAQGATGSAGLTRRRFLGRSVTTTGNSLLRVGATVQDDAVRNQLFGGGGNDWFLPGAKDTWRAG
jgi:cyclophilin family peptidyl-prolyl cis-trans isomerase